MAEHLVSPLRNESYQSALSALSGAHSFLVTRARAASLALSDDRARWGISAKRELVDLLTPDRPTAIGKNAERLVEVINMAATIERTMDALAWFSVQSDFSFLVVAECHPSTSSTKTGNDIVLARSDGTIVTRCEVTDVAASSAGQNGKELRDLKNLGCLSGVPGDGIRRFICTSAVFGLALASPKRKP